MAILSGFVVLIIISITEDVSFQTAFTCILTLNPPLHTWKLDQASVAINIQPKWKETQKLSGLDKDTQLVDDRTGPLHFYFSVLFTTSHEYGGDTQFHFLTTQPLPLNYVNCPFPWDRLLWVRVDKWRASAISCPHPPTKKSNIHIFLNVITCRKISLIWEPVD